MKTNKGGTEEKPENWIPVVIFFTTIIMEGRTGQIITIEKGKADVIKWEEFFFFFWW